MRAMSFTARPLVELADEILAAYPPTDNDVPGADRQAAIAAIIDEAARPDGASWAEIRDAAAAVARTRPRHPSWPRTWLRCKEFSPIIEAIRRRHSLPAARPPQDFLAEEHRNAQAVAAEAAATAAALADVPDDELELARRQIAEEHPEPVRSALLRQDPRRDRIARLIFARLQPSAPTGPTSAARSRLLPERFT